MSNTVFIDEWLYLSYDLACRKIQYHKVFASDFQFEKDDEYFLFQLKQQ